MVRRGWLYGLNFYRLFMRSIVIIKILNQNPIIKMKKKEMKNSFKVVLGIFVFLTKYNLNRIWNHLKH